MHEPLSRKIMYYRKLQPSEVLREILLRALQNASKQKTVTFPAGKNRPGWSHKLYTIFLTKKDPMAKKMRRPTRNTRKCFDVLAISTLTLLSTRRKHAVFWFSNFQNSNLIRSLPLERIFSLLRRDPWRRERVHEFTIFEKRFQSSDWHQSTRKY